MRSLHITLSPVQRQVPTWQRFDGVKYGYRTKEYEGLHNMYKKSRSEGFGPEVKRRIMLGSFVLSSGYYDAYYLKALRTKALIKKAFDKAFEKYDVILGPAAPTTAPKLGQSLSDPIKMYLGDIYTISVNLAGLPGISLFRAAKIKTVCRSGYSLSETALKRRRSSARHMHLNRQEPMSTARLHSPKMEE